MSLNPNQYATDSYDDVIDTWQDQWFQLMMSADETALGAAAMTSGDFYGGFQDMYQEEQGILQGLDTDLRGSFGEEEQMAMGMGADQKVKAAESALRGIGTASLDKDYMQHRTNLAKGRAEAGRGREDMMSQAFGEQGVAGIHDRFFQQGSQALMDATGSGEGGFTWDVDSAWGGTTEDEWSQFIQDETIDMGSLQNMAHAWFSGDLSGLEGVSEEILGFGGSGQNMSLQDLGTLISEGAETAYVIDVTTGEGTDVPINQVAAHSLFKGMQHWFQVQSGSTDQNAEVNGVSFRAFMDQLGFDPDSHDDYDQYGWFQDSWLSGPLDEEFMSENLGFGVGSDYMAGTGDFGMGSPYEFSSDYFSYSPSGGGGGSFTPTMQGSTGFTYESEFTPYSGGSGSEASDVLYTQDAGDDWWSNQ